MAKVKGVAIMSRVGIIKKNFGDVEWEKVVSLLPRESRAFIEAGLLASSWYPEELYRDVNQAIDKVLGPTNPNLSAKIGELVAIEGLTGVYSSKVKADVSQTIQRTPMLWKMFHDTGDIVIEMKGDNHARMSVLNYEMPHREHCKGLGSWMRKLIEFSGGGNPTQHEIKCVCKGDPHCEWDVRWE